MKFLLLWKFNSLSPFFFSYINHHLIEPLENLKFQSIFESLLEIIRLTFVTNNAMTSMLLLFTIHFRFATYLFSKTLVLMDCRGNVTM